MEHIIDTATRAPLSVTDIDAELVDAEDILGALAEPALNDDSSLAEEMAATDYALPLEVRPVLSLVPRSYQVEAMTAWLQHRGCGVVVLPTGAEKTVVALVAIECLALRLGRQLRRLVGHNEGLHALIAHLSGELRPVA